MIPIPVIRLEVDHMRHSMMVALSEYTMQLDQMLQESIERFCTPENLSKIIDEEARIVLDQVVRDSVKYWFLGSEEGKALIKKAVSEKLRKEAELYDL